jgi:hypothetical protein
MRAWINRTELPFGRRFDNATSNHSEVMLEHDKRIFAQVTDLMHAAAAILMPLGFFLSMPSPNTTAPNLAVSLIFLGGVLLAISVSNFRVWTVSGALR